MSLVITERHEDVLAAVGHGETAVRTEYRVQVEELVEAGLIRRDVDGLTLTARGQAALARLLVD